MKNYTGCIATKVSALLLLLAVSAPLSAQYSAYMVDGSADRIIEYNLQTDARKVISGNLYSHTLNDAVYIPSRNSYFVTNNQRDAHQLFEIDASTGAVTPHNFGGGPTNSSALISTELIADMGDGRLVIYGGTLLGIYDPESQDFQLLRTLSVTLSNISQLAVEPAGTLLIHESDAIKRVDLETNEITVLVSSGLSLREFHVSPSGKIYAATQNPDAIYEVDAVTGALTLISSDSSTDPRGSGPELNGVRAMFKEASGDLIVCTINYLMRVNSITGDRTALFSYHEWGINGPTPYYNTSLIEGKDGRWILVNSSYQNLLQYDETANQFSDASNFPIVGSGDFPYMRNVVMDDSGNFYVSASGILWRIDRYTGNREKLELTSSRNGANTGRLVLAPDGSLIAVENSNQVAIIDLDTLTKTMRAVDYTGERRGLTVGSDGTIYVAEGGSCIDPSPALHIYPPLENRSIVDLSPYAVNLAGVTFGSDGILYIATSTLSCDPEITTKSTLLAMDPSTLTVEMIADEVTGTGVEILRASDVRQGPDGLIYVLDGAIGRIITVDPITKHREIAVESLFIKDTGYLPQGDFIIAMSTFTQQPQTQQLADAGVFNYPDAGTTLTLQTVPDSPEEVTVSPQVRADFRNRNHIPRSWKIESDSRTLIGELSFQLFPQEFAAENLEPSQLKLFRQAPGSGDWQEIPTTLTGNTLATDGPVPVDGLFVIGVSGAAPMDSNVSTWMLY